ncbi:MAG: sigma factor-like helix-turn-helix DNA-binding protein [Candidatus Peregrinibacteria bacterium]|nr:sigma factor-like helix-turn-helix DNA-binding protein [Candidatus Peregrinibacteria bacterium]
MSHEAEIGTSDYSPEVKAKFEAAEVLLREIAPDIAEEIRDRLEEPNWLAKQQAEWAAIEKKEQEDRENVLKLLEGPRSDEENRLLQSLFENLRPREKKTLELRYGLTQTGLPLSVAQVAVQIEYSKSHTRNILRRAMDKLITARERYGKFS